MFLPLLGAQLVAQKITFVPVFTVFDTLYNLDEVRMRTHSMKHILSPYENPTVASIYTAALKLADGSVDAVAIDTFKESVPAVIRLFEDALDYLANPLNTNSALAENAEEVKNSFLVRTASLRKFSDPGINMNAAVLEKARKKGYGNRFEPTRVIFTMDKDIGVDEVDQMPKVYVPYGTTNIVNVLNTLKVLPPVKNPASIIQRVKANYIDLFEPRITEMIESIMDLKKKIVFQPGTGISAQFVIGHTAVQSVVSRTGNLAEERYNGMVTGIHEAIVDVLKYRIPIILNSIGLSPVKVTAMPTVGANLSSSVLSTVLRLEGPDGKGAIGIETEKMIEGMYMPGRIDLIPRTFIDINVPAPSPSASQASVATSPSTVGAGTGAGAVGIGGAVLGDLGDAVVDEIRKAPAIIDRKIRRARRQFAIY